MHTMTIHLFIGLLGVSCNDEIFINEGVEKPLLQLGGDLGARGLWEYWTVGSWELGGGGSQLTWHE